jgi:hypothetical protein
MSPVSSVLVSILVVGLAYLGGTAAVVIGAAIRRGGRRDDPTPGHEALAVSRFTIPVSIVVPVNAGSPSPLRLVDQLFSLSYPEFEVIVVAEGLSTERLDALAATWGLESKEFFYRHTLNTAPVRRIFRSPQEGRLMLVEKLRKDSEEATHTPQPRGPADSINCGCNLARYRYLAVVDAGLSVERDALLRAMGPALVDPSHVGATVSLIERRASETQQPTGGWPRLAARFQQLTSIRAFMESRIFAPRVLPEPAVHDAVVVWRRDAFLEAGGLRPEAVNPAADLMLRLLAAAGPGVPSGALTVRTGEIFGHASCLPQNELFDATTRRQAAAVRIVRGTLREAAIRRYVVVREVLTPSAYLLVLGALADGLVAGIFTLPHVVQGLLTVALGTAAVTVAALVVRGASAETPELRELVHLVLASALEPLLSKPRLFIARIKGLWLGLSGA